MQGPNNILGMTYMSAPVSITVEGANIMTRTLMIFGQGATRCHPYALKVVGAVEQDDARAFRKNLLGWIGHFAVNVLRSGVRYLTRGASAGSPVSGPAATYYRRLAWAATRFAVLTDLAMFAIGGKLKLRGKLTGRYADALAWQILAVGALRRYEAEGRQAEDLPLLHYAVRYALSRVQAAFEGIYHNFDAPLIGVWLRTAGLLFLRLNPLATPPSDAQSHQCARAIQSLSDQYRRLTAGVFLPPEESPGAGRLLKAFRVLDAAQPVLAKIHAAQKSRQLPRGTAEELAPDAASQGLISAEEAALVREALAARLEAIEVDVFTPEQYFGVINPHGALERAPLRLAAHG
jgi:acyl-CoA dehydrogenase